MSRQMNLAARRKVRIGLPTVGGDARCVASVALVCVLVPVPLRWHDVARLARLWPTQEMPQGSRVEEERGAGPTGSRPFPFPAHQTGRARFGHPAFRQTSPSAHGGFRHEKTQYTQFAEYNSVRELGRAQRGHVVATSQKHPYALIYVVIDGPIGRVTVPLAVNRKVFGSRPARGAKFIRYEFPPPYG